MFIFMMSKIYTLNAYIEAVEKYTLFPKFRQF